MSTILILGSGPNVTRAAGWDKQPFDQIVAINNAWQVRPDWDALIFPDDFAVERQPNQITQQQRLIRSADYVPAQNSFGGFVYAGGTMAFTAAYWALATYRPKVIAMMGCDMVYDAVQTHFYGTGTADPLRDDISLRSLEAKSNRLLALAANAGCAMVNLSTDPSRLTFPRATPLTAAASIPVRPDASVVAAALNKERALGYVIPSGRYWQHLDQFDAAEIDALDALWLRSIPQS